MKGILLFLLCLPVIGFGQLKFSEGNGIQLSFDTSGTVTIDGTPEKIQIDTIYGLLIYVQENKIVTERGMRINKLETYSHQIPCPEDRFGCMVLHWGSITDVVASNYFINGKEIDTKYLIKFIEE